MKKFWIKKNSFSDNFTKTVGVSIVVILTFSLLPPTTNVISKYFKYNNTTFSNAGINFDNVALESSLKEFRKTEKLVEDTSQKFADITITDNSKEIQNAPRFNVLQITNVFKQTKYSLNQVRKTKLVNPGNSISRLPGEMKNFKSVSKKKEFFIQIVLPLILEENTSIKIDRIKLFSILNKKYNTKRDKEWLIKKLDQYGVKNNDLSTLKIRMDEVPVSLAIAQAAKETGWGTSRFAQEGNALFGQWTWTGDGIKPSEAEKDSKHKVAKFNILQSSVRAYLRNLNTHASYVEFRKERAIQRDNDQDLNSYLLVEFLDKYAETGKEYVKIIKKIIEQNSLTDFDDVKILPTSLKLKKLI